VFTARYTLNPYSKQICFVFKGLMCETKFHTHSKQQQQQTNLQLFRPTWHGISSNLGAMSCLHVRGRRQAYQLLCHRLQNFRTRTEEVLTVTKYKWECTILRKNKRKQHKLRSCCQNICYCSMVLLIVRDDHVTRHVLLISLVILKRYL
jgi:hypothetical protein